MPCDSIQLNRVDLPKMQPALRARALAAMTGDQYQANSINFAHKGHRFYIQAGELVSSTASAEEVQAAAALLKKHYSAQVVKYSAQRQGWKVRQVSEFQYEVIK
jgi:hypothetical protein